MANPYSIAHTNHLGDVIIVTLTPKAVDFFGNPITLGPLIQLKALPGMTYGATSGDDDKTQCGIISKELAFGYLDEKLNPVPVDTFVADDFDYWKIQATLNGDLFFSGYFGFEASEPLFNRNETVFLKATDGLNALKSFEPYRGTSKNTVLFHMVQILGQLDMPEIRLRTLCNVTNSLMTGRDIDPTFDPLDNIWIEDKLFAEIDAYEALDLICKNFKIRFYQEGGYWYAEHIGERLLQREEYSWSEYEIPGTLTDDLYDYTQITSVNDVNLLANIGRVEEIRLVNADAIRYITKPTKEVKLTFNYKLPKPWFCDQELQDYGALIPIVDPPASGAYELPECWTFELEGGGDPPQQAYAYQELDPDGNITDYVARIEDGFPYGGTNIARLRSEPFYVGSGDRFTFGVETRIDKEGEDFDSAGYFSVARIVLQSHTGNIYTLGRPVVFSMDFREREFEPWLLSANTNIEDIDLDNDAQIAIRVEQNEIKSEWRSVSVTSEVIPEAGALYFDLIGWGRNSAGLNPLTYHTDFKNIQVDAEIRSVGQSKGVKGDTNTLTNSRNSVPKYDETVEISDLPGDKIQIQGGLYKGPDISPTLTELYPKQWDYYGIFVPQPHRFTGLMAAVVRGHNAKSRDKIETSFKPYTFLLNETLYWAGFLPRYKFQDYDADKEFMLTGNYSVDLTTGICRGVFVEVKNTLEELVSGLGDDATFNYIT